jgi:hypothetical protein
MEIHFLMEASGQALAKIRSAIESEDQLNAIFAGKEYSPDLQHVFVRLLCMSPKLEHLFSPQPPKFNAQPKNVMHRGARIERPAASFEYDLQLDFTFYNEMTYIGPRLATDIIDSFDVIATNKKIREFNLAALKADMTIAMQQLGWTGSSE